MIVITGRTCSGKDTLGKFLEEEYGFLKLITFTTRPPRPGEANGEDYFFISDKEFDEMFKDGDFAETTSYKQENGDIWRYGTTKDDYREEKDTRKLYVILNPDGLMQLIRNGCHVDILHLKDDYEPRLRDRYISRELGDISNMNGREASKKMEEIRAKFNVRFAQDTKDFAPYEEGLSEATENHPEVDSVHKLSSYTKSSITKMLISLGYIEKAKSKEELEDYILKLEKENAEFKKVAGEALNETHVLKERNDILASSVFGKNYRELEKLKHENYILWEMIDSLRARLKEKEE